VYAKADVRCCSFGPNPTSATPNPSTPKNDQRIVSVGISAHIGKSEEAVCGVWQASRRERSGVVVAMEV
jgi:hypothetical protein